MRLQNAALAKRLNNPLLCILQQGEVNTIDSDRPLFCSCVPVAEYA